MTGLPGVEKVRSVSNFGLSVVNVYFEEGMDIYFCRQLVNERLQEAREQIPEGFGEPEMGPISTGMGLVLFYYLDDARGRYTLEELRTIHDWIVKLNLQTVPGVTCSRRATTLLSLPSAQAKMMRARRASAAADRDRCANESSRCRSSVVKINATFGRPFRMLASLYGSTSEPRHLFHLLRLQDTR